MLFESRHLRVTAEHGTATLWLAFPGEPVNAFDLARLGELDAAIAAVAAARQVRVLVVRSALPAGFCAGLRPECVASLPHPSDRAAFAWYGQQVFDRLAQLDAVTLAFIDGPCLGVGLELALACDRRVCVARPTTHLGFPNRLACFGGSARLRHILGRRAGELLTSGETLSGREAQKHGIVDVACCERRGKIELRTFLDRLERRPVKPRQAELVGLAEERRAFAGRAVRPVVVDAGTPPHGNPIPQFPAVVGMLGEDPNAARLIGEVVLRGGSAVVCGDAAGILSQIDIALKRGFVTPLEAEQARSRVRVSDSLARFDRAGLVFVGKSEDPFRLAAVVRPRTVVCVVRPLAGLPTRSDVPFPFPRRVLRMSFSDPDRVALFPGSATDEDTLATVGEWLKPFGLATVVFPPAAKLLPRAA